MREVDVYIPTPGARTTIDAGSGIVRRFVAGSHPKRLELYFEGNRFGAANIVTFADRVYHAADRMQGSYPTIARGIFSADDFEQVGTFDGDRVQLLPDGGLLSRLARWIGAGVDDEGRFTPDVSRLDAELRRSW